jgi:NAD-dependent dihydropyrimidine dehydrogenase PreA subunit
MCEFCTEHGEGRKWYLEMKNYSDELLHAEMTGRERKLAGVATRAEWLDRFVDSFVLPAAGVQSRQENWESAEQAEDKAQRFADEKAVHFGQVLPLKDVEEVLDLATSIARIPCGCRYLLTGKTNARYCFGLGIDRSGVMGRYPDAASSLEVMDPEEAKRIIRKFDEDGLVHSVWTGMTPYVIGVCNCDRDCGAYRHYIMNRGSPTFFRAEYVAGVDPELCTGCKSCMTQCQFGAQFFSHAGQKVYIDPERCFGCGVCMAACPNNAIRLSPRQEHAGAKGIWLETPARPRQ